MTQCIAPLRGTLMPCMTQCIAPLRGTLMPCMTQCIAPLRGTLVPDLQNRTVQGLVRVYGDACTQANGRS